MGKSMRKTFRTIAFMLGIIAMGMPAFGEVLPGNSSLIGTLDYSDTFTTGGGLPPRDLNYYYNGATDDATDGYYDIETAYHSLSEVQWRETRTFAFVNDAGSASDPNYPGNTGNAGASTGRARAAAPGYAGKIAYGLRSDYVIQFDMVNTGTTAAIEIITCRAGDNYWWSDYNNVSIRFVGDGSIGLRGAATSPGVGTLTDTGFVSGVDYTDRTWHNYAVAFDATNHTISFYVDEIFKGSIDTTTFAGGIYDGWNNGAVGFSNSGDTAWYDNFQVGSAVPEPATMLLVACGGLAVACKRRK